MKKNLLGLLVVALLLAACGGAGGTETAAPGGVTEVQPEKTLQPSPMPTAAPTKPPVATERTTIRFAVNDFLQPMYRDMIQAFEEENSDLHVEFVSQNEVLGLGAIAEMEIPDDAEQRLVAAADVVSMGISRQTVEQGLVRDLSPFIQAEPNFQPDDYYSSALSAYQWQGGTWALPTMLNYQFIFYNKDLFDEAGVPYPEVGWTWDDLLAKAKALTEGQGDQVTRWGFVPNGAPYRLIESYAGSLVDYSATPLTPRYDANDVVEAVRWYTNLYLKEQVMPYFAPADEEGNPLVSDEQALVDGGQAAMWSDADLMWWIRSQQANIGVVPFPTGGSGAGLTPVSADAIVMSAGTKQPEATWRWMDYIGRQSLGTMTMGIRFLPARRSAAETGGFWDSLNEEFAAALRYATDHSYVAREPVAYNAFEDALNAILKGEESAEDALAEAQTQAEAQIEEYVAAQAGATPVPTFVVAPPEGGTPVAGGAVTIAFVPGLGSLNLEPFRDLASQFHEAHPDIIVDVKMADFLTGAPSLPAMAEGADCFEWYPSFQEAANRDAILSLAPFVDADTSFTSDDYIPQAMQQFMWQGQLMGLPADITPYVIEFNKDLFDAAGVDYPALDWTWDDFLQLAVDLTQGEGDTRQYGFVAEYYELNDLLLLTERLGAKLIDTSADPPALSYDDPATVEAMRWYTGLTTEHQVKRVFVTDLSKLLAEATTAMFEREGLINDGHAAMWTSSATAAAVFGERTGMNVGAAPPPRRADGTSPGAVLTTSGYFISAQTENRQACWQWITFLNGQPAAVQGLPARLSVAQSDAYRQKVGAEHADAYLASIGESEQPSAFQIFTEEEWLGGAIYWYGQAFGQVIDGKASVEDALDAAQKLADDYRACVVAGGDFSQKAWQACLKQIDPTLPDFLFVSSQ
jgi:ABC-type glycerol-3-phosphate transport system substrate-binding protein